MTRDELLRILTFSDTWRSLCEERTSLSGQDARWNIISYAMRRHLEGKMLTVTSAAAASGVPYGTAMRRIGELIDEELLLKRPRSKSGRSFSLHPTRKLIREVESYALLLKSHVGNAFGFTQSGSGIEDFFFGASYMAPKILSFPNAMRTAVGYDRTVRLLCPIDPTFKTLADQIRTLNELCGASLDITTLPIDELHEAILENHGLAESSYDIVSFDLPWIGELSQKGIIQPLDDIIETERYNASDFHTAAWKGSRSGGKQYGVPIQPTAELLFYRADLFSEAGLQAPKSSEDVLFAAKTLQGSRFGLSGIVMNFGRGTPVAHTFVLTLADFGQPVIDLPWIGDEFDVGDIEGEHFRPMIDTEAGRRTAEHLLALRDYAHPESMQCNWDKRIALFAGGKAAMTYGWSVRAAAFELDEKAAAHGQVDFAVHPPAPGARAVSPIGGFALAIPAGLSEERTRSAWKVVEYLTRPELMKWYVQAGNLTSPRFSTSADPEVRSFSKIIDRIDAMERRGEIQLWPRPPVPEFSDILYVLGEEIHDMLGGRVTAAAALSSAQNRVDAVMRANGRY